jgi:hypothetical protein
MADENQEIQNTTPEVKELSPVELKAKDQGWVPQDEWDGEADAWRPAKEFLDRGELFKKIDEQSRTIKEFKKTLEELKKHNAKISEVEYKRALDDLKSKKKEALLEGDADAVVDIDEKMALVRDAQKEVVQETSPATAELNPIFVSWVEKNSWYHNNKAMRAFADSIGNELGAKGMSPTDILAQVEREVKKEFAEKFTNPNRQKASGVEGSTNKGGKAKDTFQLTEEQRRVMQRFVRAGVITEEKYIADLKKAEGV